MKRGLYIFSFLLIYCSSSIDCFAQKSKPMDPYMEMGLTVGYSYYIGDINPYTHFGPRKKSAYGALYRLNLTKRHVLRFQGLRLNVEGYDSDNSDQDLINRNLNFRNKITEVSMLLEINFHPYGLGRIGEGFTPYAFGGLAFFSMNPETEYEGTYIELQPLATEGQGSDGGPSPYKKNQLSIPFGMGIKMALSKRLAFNMEWGIRRTWTDYIDDVSGQYADPSVVRNISGDLGRDLADRTIESMGPDGDNTGLARGNPETRDYYFYSGMILSYRLGKDDKGCWKGGR